MPGQRILKSMFFFFLTLNFKSGEKYYWKKKLLKMEMSDLSDERNLDKSKVLSV